MTEVAPSARLTGHVDRYVAYSENTGSFAARRELAATSGVLIFVLGDPLVITAANGDELVLKAGEAFVGGIADATSISRALGPQRGIHVHMPIDSLAAVCGTPAAAIANRCERLTDVVGGVARSLGDALCTARGSAERFDLLDDFLEARIARGADDDRPVKWALRRLTDAAAPSIEALAGEIGWSRKHLANRFAAATGFTPQTYRRLARFERFAATLAAEPEGSLAMLAADAGYHDQAHLGRDVMAFGAMTPGELRRRLIPAQGGVRDD